MNKTYKQADLKNVNRFAMIYGYISCMSGYGITEAIFYNPKNDEFVAMQKSTENDWVAGREDGLIFLTDVKRVQERNAGDPMSDDESTKAINSVFENAELIEDMLSKINNAKRSK